MVLKKMHSAFEDESTKISFDQDLVYGFLGRACSDMAIKGFKGVFRDSEYFKNNKKEFVPKSLNMFPFLYMYLKYAPKKETSLLF